MVRNLKEPARRFGMDAGSQSLPQQQLAPQIWRRRAQQKWRLRITASRRTPVEIIARFRAFVITR